jgi:hypothetical protein
MWAVASALRQLFRVDAASGRVFGFEVTRATCGLTKEAPAVWWRILTFAGAIFLILGFTARAQDAALARAETLDHVTTVGPACPPYPCAEISLQDQARYVLGNWPRDFKIAVVHATDSPKCKRVADRNQCTLHVKLDDLILGTQEPDDGTRRTRVGWYDSFGVYYSVYAPAAGAASRTFQVKPGDRLVAMLSPAIHPNDQPVSYVGTRLDHASDGVIQSVGAAVADILTAAAHAGAKP